MITIHANDIYFDKYGFDKYMHANNIEWIYDS